MEEEITFKEAILPAAVITVVVLAGYMAWEKMSEYRSNRKYRLWLEHLHHDQDKVKQIEKLQS